MDIKTACVSHLFKGANEKICIKYSVGEGFDNTRLTQVGW